MPNELQLTTPLPVLLASAVLRPANGRVVVRPVSGNEAYFVEVSSFSRSGFVALINFRAQGDGSLGALSSSKRTLT